MKKDFLPYPAHYSMRLNLEFLERSPKELVHRVIGGIIFKLIRIDSELYLTNLNCLSNGIEITYLNQSPKNIHRSRILEYVADWLDFNTDLAPFYNIAQRDSIMKKLVTRYYGYRIVGIPDLYESLSWAVTGQQINLSFGYSLKQRLVETFGDHFIYDGVSHFLFPRPEVIAELEDKTLLALQFSKQKATYLLNIARAFADGSLSREKIAALPFEEAKAELQRIKGIGNWTANYALMKTLRYPNAFPLEDAGLHNAIKNLHDLAAKPTLDEVKTIFKKFRGWEAYATLYYWKSL